MVSDNSSKQAKSAGLAYQAPPRPEFSTKNEWVYACIKADITQGILAPGERLVAARLTKRYNVSPMPVRDALNRLHQEGFVELTPHAGATVVSIDGEQLYEIVYVRMELAAIAAGLAVPRLQRPEIFNHLESLHRQMQAHAAAGDRLSFEAPDRAFHECFYSHCGNKTLYDLVMSLWRRSCITRAVFVRMVAKLEQSAREHGLMLDAVRAGDAEKVRALTYEHARHTLERLKHLQGPPIQDD